MKFARSVELTADGQRAQRRTGNLMFVAPNSSLPGQKPSLASLGDTIDLTTTQRDRVVTQPTAPPSRGAVQDAPVALPSRGAVQDAPVAPPSRGAVQDAPVATLVELAGSGCSKAWAELVNRFGGMIAATGRRYRLSPSDIAELQQTTWLRLVENLHRIEQPERVGGWLATTARRESLHLLRRSSKYRSGVDQILANMPDKHLPDPDARPIAKEREVVLRAAWDQLKPRCRELLSLLIADDPLGYKDLSKLLQMPVGSIGPTRGRCLEHLRRLVTEQDISNS